VSALDIAVICPLHGPVHRENFDQYIEKYRLWSSYTPEETGVMIAYASIYGNTANAAQILACRLFDAGIKVRMFDVSVDPASEIVSAAFRMSHLVFAASTYNAGVFVTMEEVLRDLVLHNIQNRTVAFIENGTWAPASGKLMRDMLARQKNMTFLENAITIRSALKESQSKEMDALVSAISATVSRPEIIDVPKGEIEPAALFTLSYGLFVLTAREGEKDNGSIINTVTQISSAPKRVSISVSKDSLTHDMVLRTGVFNISVLTETSKFDLYERFGLQSGRDAEKFEDFLPCERSANGLMYVTENVNALMSCKVISAVDYGSHTLFVADLTEARKLSGEPSVTYDYYRRNIKPKPGEKAKKKKGWLCTVCGYIYEGEVLPPDFICPICKHGVEVFVPLDQA
jgi:flavin reductase (DIM6/NTAB) family NADH-FMN oxidoreductase RutF/flavodoxin/rubredoxin